MAWIGGTQDELESTGVPASDLFRFNKNTYDFKVYDLPVGRSHASIAVDVSHFDGDEVHSTGGGGASPTGEVAEQAATSTTASGRVTSLKNARASERVTTIRTPS